MSVISLEVLESAVIDAYMVSEREAMLIVARWVNDDQLRFTHDGQLVISNIIELPSEL